MRSGCEATEILLFSPFGIAKKRPAYVLDAKTGLWGDSTFSGLSEVLGCGDANKKVQLSGYGLRVEEMESPFLNSILVSNYKRLSIGLVVKERYLS